MSFRLFKLAFISFWLGFIPCNMACSANEHILLISSEGDSFKQTVKALKDDLADDINFIEKFINSDSSSEKISRLIRDTNPKLLVLLGNKPLQAYAQYQKNQTGTNFPPGIALSALYIDRQLKYLKNINGIRYEIPAVTSLVHLRSIVKRPITKVGVIYREWMSDFIKQNQAYCQQEAIELFAVKIPDKTSIRQLNYQLKHLLNSDIDALWVVNDNGLLRPRYIQNTWIPLLKRFNKPVLVGISSLTESSLNFGTFSVEVDHYALGIQAAEMISDIMDNSWRISQHKIEQPLSIKTLLNIKLSEKKNILLNSQKFDEIDQLIR